MQLYIPNMTVIWVMILIPKIMRRPARRPWRKRPKWLKRSREDLAATGIHWLKQQLPDNVMYRLHITLVDIPIVWVHIWFLTDGVERCWKQHKIHSKRSVCGAHLSAPFVAQSFCRCRRWKGCHRPRNVVKQSCGILDAISMWELPVGQRVIQTMTSEGQRNFAKHHLEHG